MLKVDDSMDSSTNLKEEWNKSKIHTIHEPKSLVFVQAFSS